MFELPRQRVLLLGLGGGDIVKLFGKYQPEAKLTVIEKEEELITIAAQYFGVRESDNTQIVVADANKYVTTNKEKFDLIIVDLYSGDDVPDFVGSQIFLDKLKQTISQRGSAVFNYASHSFRDQDFLRFQKKLQQTFGWAKNIDIWGHRYFVAKNQVFVR